MPYARTKRPEEIVDDFVVWKLVYEMDDEGRVRVRGARGAGKRIIQALLAAGYEIRLREGYSIEGGGRSPTSDL